MLKTKKKSQNGARNKKQASREHTKDNLMRAALEMFSTNGFDATSTKLVAQRARVNESLIFRYFGDKVGLLTAVVLSKIAENESSMHDYKPGQSAAEEVCNYMNHHFKSDYSHRRFLKVAISRCLVDNKMRKRILHHIPVRGDPFLTGRLEALRKQGRWSVTLSPEQISLHVCTYQTGMMLTMVALDALTPKVAHEQIREFCRGLGLS